MDSMDCWWAESKFFIFVWSLIVNPVGGHEFIPLTEYLSTEMLHDSHTHILHLATIFHVLFVLVLISYDIGLFLPFLKRELKSFKNVESELF